MLGKGGGGEAWEGMDEKCSLPRAAKASNLGHGWNFTWGRWQATEVVCKGE